MSALTAILLLPLLLTVLTTTLELGALRVVAARVRSAADVAVLVAVNDQDDAELARSGRLVPAADAEQVARDVFAANLEPIAAALAISPGAVAAQAVVRIDTTPPTVSIRVTVPIRTPMFGALFFRPVTEVAITSSGGAR